MKTLSLFCFLIITLISFGQNTTYYVGHSLVNLDMPFQTKEITDHAGLNNTFRHHINIGAGLKTNWLDSDYNSNLIWYPDLGMNIEHGTDHNIELLNSFDNIVITESVPLMQNIRDTTVLYASNFYDLAQSSNPSIKKFLYATWEHAAPDWGMPEDWVAWRASLTTLQSEWENIADQAAAASGGEVFIVPGNLAVMALYDQLEIGPIAGITAIDELFNDDVHLSFEGNYLIACLMAAVVYHVDPRGQGLVGGGPYTSDSVVENDELRLALQTIAWETACGYDRAGLDCTGLGLNSLTNEIVVSPNPIINELLIQSTSRKPLKIINSLGQDMYSNDFISENLPTSINTSKWNSGMYFVLQEGTQVKKIVKQ